MLMRRSSKKIPVSIIHTWRLRPDYPRSFVRQLILGHRPLSLKVLASINQVLTTLMTGMFEYIENYLINLVA